VGTGTAYLRLKDNQHWLSDTLAGAAIGISTGVFVDHRATAARGAGRWSVRPAAGGGLAVNYTHPLD
jgi:membrane-associated phospholipid phosphatase